MKRRTVLAGVPLVLAGCMEALEGPDGSEAESEIVEEINDFRGDHGLGVLGIDDTLREAARDHSRDMAERGFYDHRNPEGEGPGDRVACRAGETIHGGEIGSMQNPGSSETWNTRLTAELVGFVDEGWRNSPQHADILVDSQWRAVGVGIYIGEDEFFVTAKFC